VKERDIDRGRLEGKGEGVREKQKWETERERERERDMNEQKLCHRRIFIHIVCIYTSYPADKNSALEDE